MDAYRRPARESRTSLRTHAAPNEFALTAIGYPDSIFVFAVKPGYLIETAFENALCFALADALQIGRNNEKT